MRDPVQRNTPPRSDGGGEAVGSGQPAGQSGATGTMSIGEVLGILKPEFPDITVSKIRFLEGAGLVQPDRSASGYRKFSEDDVARLRFVLRAQRDQYLPLRVIRQRLTDLERVGGLDASGAPPVQGGPGPSVEESPGAGAEPAAAAQVGPAPGAPAPTPVPAGAGIGGAQPGRAAGVFGAPPSDAQFTRDELCRAAGATADQLIELESFGLVSARGSGERGAWYGGDDLVLLRLARELADYGLEARHLRMYKLFAEREAALFEQVVAPLVRQRNPEARTRARDTIEALAQLGGRMRDLALRSAVHGLAESRDPHR
ncbi:MAG: MerR family transcriptional regulator [Actinomycetia bacterium]|nr:MerR family transcriptional regulator [Actinomycetes bacterium]